MGSECRKRHGGGGAMEAAWVKLDTLPYDSPIFGRASSLSGQLRL